MRHYERIEHLINAPEALSRERKLLIGSYFTKEYSIESEREGYLSNVVYTCGVLLHNGTLVIPYAVSDTTSGIATIELEQVLERMS